MDSAQQFRYDAVMFTPPDDLACLPDEFILRVKATAEAKRKESDEWAARYAAAKVLARPGFDPDSIVTPVSVIPSANPVPTTVQPIPSGSAPPHRRRIILRRPSSTSTIVHAKNTGAISEPSHDERPDERPSWRTAILHVLDSADGGLPHQAVMRAARAQFDLPPSNGEKAFYNALAKLAQAGAVIKHGNLLFSEKTMAAAKANGSLPPLPTVARRAGSSAELVLSILWGHPNGLTGPQLRDAMRDVPEAPKSLYEHGQYIYNVLAPLVGTGEVVKTEDGFYRISDLATEGGETS